MSLKEGMRRLALTFGIIGFMTGTLFTVRDLLQNKHQYEESQYALGAWNSAQDLDQVKNALEELRKRESNEEIRADFIKEGFSEKEADLRIRAIDTGFVTKPPETSESISAFSWPLSGFLIGWLAMKTLAWVILRFQRS